MRYKEAYELVNKVLNKYDVDYGERLLNSFFDATVEFFGLTIVKELKLEEFAADSTKTYVAQNADFSDKIRRVDIDGGSKIPYIPEEAIQDDSDSAHENSINLLNGYNIKRGDTEGDITAGTLANPIVFTSTAHGLVTGDYVFLSEIVGLVTSGELSVLNDLRHQITKVNDNSFSVDINGSGFTAFSGTGKWKNDNYILYLSKAPSSGTINVQYYKKPKQRNSLASRVDLPELLVHASIYYTIAEVLDLDGPKPIVVGDKVIMTNPGKHYKGKYLQKQSEYFTLYHANKPFPDMIPPALANFT